MSCFVCGSPTSASQGHHVVPQSRGGSDGPVVPLCANHHQLVHRGAQLMLSGKRCEHLFSDVGDAGRDRALGLVQVILLADAGGENPRPLLAVVLDGPHLLHALKRFQAEGGFASQEAAVNGLLRTLAARHDAARDNERGSRRVGIADVAGPTRKSTT